MKCQTFMNLNLIWWRTIWLFGHVTAVMEVDNTVFYDFTPFQLFYALEKDVVEEHHMSDMDLLEATKIHVAGNLESTFPQQFVRIEMYRLVRYPNEDMAMVAFGGTVYLSSPVDSELLTTSIWLAFGGTKLAQYIDLLNTFGFMVDQVTLVTLNGNTVEYVDGTMEIMKTNGKSLVESDNEMTEQMSFSLMVIAMGIPCLLFILITLGYAWLHWSGISCRRSNCHPTGIMWQVQNYQ